MNNTENKFIKVIRNNNWFGIKLNPFTSSGFGVNQIADFLVANNKGVYVIECKERKGNYFYLKDLTQSLQMRKLLNKSNKLIPYILINFYEKNKIFLLTKRQLMNIRKELKNKKGLNIKDIPKEYLITWNNINKVL